MQEMHVVADRCFFDDSSASRIEGISSKGHMHHPIRKRTEIIYMPKPPAGCYAT